jgi:hypothetical protein
MKKTKKHKLELFKSFKLALDKVRSLPSDEIIKEPTRFHVPGCPVSDKFGNIWLVEYLID